MAEKLNSSIKIRLSKEEKFSWQEKAVRAGIPLSTLIREAMGRTRTWTASDRSSLQEQTRQISRIGNNLNQIAKWANTYKSTAEAIEVIEALRAIELALTQLSTNPSSSFPEAPSPEAKQDVT
jgi:Bacterial mobilisation protein (MobC)